MGIKLALVPYFCKQCNLFPIKLCLRYLWLRLRGDITPLLNVKNFEIMFSFAQKFVGLTAQLLQYACIGHCTFTYLGNFVMCQGPSMEPTLFSDDIILIEHITPTINKLNRGDIIIAKCPFNPQQNICKRVVALQGDKIRTGFTSQIVPIGHVWLEGDNKSNSSDSRNYGPVPLGLVRSRAIIRIYPFKDFSFLNN